MFDIDESIKTDYHDPKTHTLHPTATGTSVIGLVYNEGVVLAADSLVSYGSLARYKGFDRILKVNDKTAMACSGDMADFQFIKDVVEKMTLNDNLFSDQFSLTPHGIHSWITRVMYNRRSKFNPLWNTYLTAGVNEGKPFLAYCNMLGVSFEENCVATGFGSFLAIPHLRKIIESHGDDVKNVNLDTAVEGISSVMRLLYYRDCRAFDNYQMAVITKDGVEIKKDLKLNTNWSLASYVKGYE